MAGRFFNACIIQNKEKIIRQNYLNKVGINTVCFELDNCPSHPFTASMIKGNFKDKIKIPFPIKHLWLHLIFEICFCKAFFALTCIFSIYSTYFLGKINITYKHNFLMRKCSLLLLCYTENTLSRLKL